MPSITIPLPARIQRLTATNGMARQNAVDEAIRLLRGPRSLWPVDTGRSKRAWRRLGSGLSSQIFNPLRYASYVERFSRRSARRTLQANQNALREAAQRTTIQEPDSTRAGILEAFSRRAILEQDEGVRNLYVAALLTQRRGPPRISAIIRRLDQRIRREATP